MKLVSEVNLPPEERSSATKEQILNALESLERDFKRTYEDPLAEMYRVNAKKIKQITQSIEGTEILIEDKNKAFDRWLKMLEAGSKIGKSQGDLRKNSSLDYIIIDNEETESDQSFITQRAKNGD